VLRERAAVSGGIAATVLRLFRVAATLAKESSCNSSSQFFASLAKSCFKMVGQVRNGSGFRNVRKAIPYK
jgi:hypothetical protein